MARAYVAVDGAWKSVSSPYVAVDGRWKAVPSASVAQDGAWKAAHSGAPSVVLFSASKHPKSPWGRLQINWTVHGTWGSIVTSIEQLKGARVDIHASDPSGPAETTGMLRNHYTDRLVPGATYDVVLSWVDAYGARSLLAKQRVVLDPVPMIPGMSLKTPISHQAGGVQWERIEDADGYVCRNDTLGTQWETSSTGNYIHYSSGLKASTKYAFRAAVRIGDKTGPWTPQHFMTTSAAPYSKGTFRLTPSGASETYQSGGSQGAKWQGSSRSLFYAANGSAWGSTRGTQRTCFFYNRDANWNKVADAVAKGGKITGARLYINRQGSEGYNSGVPAVVALHSTSKPSGPNAYTGNHITGSFARNTSGWVSVPADWAWHVITGRCSGVMLGNSSSSSHYMSLNKGSGLLDVDVA